MEDMNGIRQIGFHGWNHSFVKHGRGKVFSWYQVIGSQKTFAGLWTFKLLFFLCLYFKRFIALKRGASGGGENDGAEQGKSKCWKNVAKKMVGNKMQTTVGKLTLSTRWIPIPVRMKNDHARCGKFKYMDLNIFYINEL